MSMQFNILTPLSITKVSVYQLNAIASENVFLSLFVHGAIVA